MKESKVNQLVKTGIPIREAILKTTRENGYTLDKDGKFKRSKIKK